MPTPPAPVRCRAWCHQGDLPVVGELLDLEEVDPQGRPTGRRVRARVETAPPGGERRASSTQRLFAVDVPRDPPHLCLCGHVRTLHADRAGVCTLCPKGVCWGYIPTDPRREPDDDP